MPVCLASDLGLLNSAVVLHELTLRSSVSCSSPTTLDAGPSGFSGETNGWCYKAVNSGGSALGMTWPAAEAACIATGATQAHLAAVRDATQKTTVMDSRCANLIPYVATSPANYWCVLSNGARALKGHSAEYNLHCSCILGRRPRPVDCEGVVCRQRQALVRPPVLTPVFLCCVRVRRWIGFTDDHTEGTFQFSSGASPAYANSAGLWNTGEPNNSGGNENCAQVWSTGKLNDLSCTTTTVGSGDYLWGCCEAPASPVNTCPAGFTGQDASGMCYKALTVSGGYSWDAASSACRALNSGNAWLGSMIDAATGASVVTNMCAGLLTGTSFWSGLRDKYGPIAGHTDPAGSYWHWMSGGFVSTYMPSASANFLWNSGA